MHRIVLMLLLVVVSNSAMAEWVKIYSEDAFAIYVDSSTIRKNGSKVKLWQIVDYSKPQDTAIIGPAYSSTKGQFELDCRSEQVNQIYFLLQTGNMGQGRTVVAYEAPKPWLPVVPDTAIQIVWKYACEKK
jgi:hypothetical protein